MAVLNNCSECVYPYIGNGKCPCGRSLRNAACLLLAESISQCHKTKCRKCKYYEACYGKIAEMNEKLNK